MKQWSTLKKLIWLFAATIKRGATWAWETITGNSPLTLLLAASHAIQSLTQYGLCTQRNLPAEYTQLDYIEGDGTAYIDTGVLLSNTDVFEITFQSLNVLASPVMGAISGGTSYTSTNNLSVTYTIGAGLSAYAVYCDGEAGNVDYSWNGGNRADGLKHTIKYNGLNIAPMLDGVAMTQVTSHTLVENTPTVTTWLFGRNSTSTGTLAQSGVRIFDFNIQSKGHFIPARRNSDNVLGMYDLVSGQFLTNAGTGSFTAGPDAVPTPNRSMDIWCNNGVIKCSANMANVNEQTARVGYYISAQGEVLADQYNWFYQDYIRVKPNTTYTLSMPTPVYYVTISEYSTAENSGFIVRKNGTVGDNRTLTVTTGANTNYVRFGSNLNRVTVSMAMVLAIDWMFNLGGTAMDYQPYVEGGIYTDGTPEVLTVSGANLANMVAENIAVGKIIYETGTVANSAVNFVYNKYIPVEAGQNYVLYGRRKSDNAISAYNRICWYTANKGWISRATYTKDTIGSAVAPNNAAYARFTVAPYESSSALTLDDVLSFDWTFAKATEEIPYQPYVAPQTVGWKNLFDKNDYTEINAYVNANTGVLTTGSPGSITQYCAVIPCEPNTQYNITGQGTSAWGAFTSDSIGTTATAYTKGGNLTTGANDRYLIGLVRANGDSIDYRNTLVVRETVTDIPMLLSVGDYKDEQEILSGVVTRKVGVLVLDGTEAWEQYTTGSVTRFSTKSPTGFDIPKDSNMRAYCNILVDGGYQTSGTTMQNGTFSYTSAQSIYLRMAPNNGITTVEGWQQWLADQYAAGTPVIVVYPLATETTEQTTPQHLVTNRGTNVVEAEANVEPVELEIVYAKEG